MNFYGMDLPVNAAVAAPNPNSIRIVLINARSFYDEFLSEKKCEIIEVLVLSIFSL